MSETVPVNYRTLQEYDTLFVDRVRSEKMARHVIYTLMMEIEGNDHLAGAVTVDLASLPVFGADKTAASSKFGINFMDSDFQPAFQIPAVIKNEELYLVEQHLRIVSTGHTLDHGYLLVNEDGAYMAMQLQEMIGAGSSIA